MQPGFIGTCLCSSFGATYRYFFLLFSRGLPTLHTLFPNLRVIRGASLIYNYALVIYQSSLRHIGLHNLAVIERGSVRIAENKHLCNTDSVNWLKILAQEHAHSQITMELNQDPSEIHRTVIIAATILLVICIASRYLYRFLRNL